ncbi:MAG: hypothetical protein G01um10147_10 [Microgenomates group bacterium Gr01-1014_7]|nr:MAG: hypothetical protein G01um10147_10 [Microgenomates group bacterium Gr01-1014_7]
MNNKKTFNLTSKSFAKIFNTKEDTLPLIAKQAIKKANFKYKKVENKEYDEAILRIIRTLDSRILKAAGPHRQIDWEKGWEENLQEFIRGKRDLNQLIPKFVKKGAYIRFQGNFIKPESDLFETDFVTVLRYYLFSKYYKNTDTLYEFGVGSGLNLVAASEIFPEMKLVGLDWASSSVEILNSLKQKLKINISGKRMDFFNPDGEYRLNKDSAILTIGTLEQLGENFKPFINYLLKNKPKVCIHIETLYEVYDQSNLLDYLAIKYLEKRNYLRGFLPYLKNLEAKKKIRILEMRRTFGSFYHEGYTYTVWRPI